MMKNQENEVTWQIEWSLLSECHEIVISDTVVHVREQKKPKSEHCSCPWMPGSQERVHQLRISHENNAEWSIQWDWCALLSKKLMHLMSLKKSERSEMMDIVHALGCHGIISRLMRQ